MNSFNTHCVAYLKKIPVLLSYAKKICEITCTTQKYNKCEVS